MEQSIETTIDPAGQYMAVYSEQKVILSQSTIFDIIVDRVIKYGPYRYITPELILLKTRQRGVCTSRQIVMYFYRRITGESLTATGRMFTTNARPNGYDHSTVISAIKKVKDLCDSNKHFRHHVDLIKVQLDIVLK